MAEVTLFNLAPQGSTPSTVGSPAPAALHKFSTAVILSSPSSFAQLPPSLSNLFSSSSTRTSYQNVDNILERQSLFSAPFLSARQAQADAWIGRVEDVALGSRTIGLLVGGALALQAVRGLTVTQEFQM